MQPLPHHYTTQLTAGTGDHGQLSAPARPVIDIAAPTEFGGPGDAWSPEHLLLGAVEACFLMTLRAVASASKLELIGVDAAAFGTVDRVDGVTRFSAIEVRPIIRVPAGTELERVRKVVERTERNCLITASLRTPVQVHADIRLVSADSPDA